MTVWPRQSDPAPREWRAARTDVDELSLVVVYLGGLDELGPDRLDVEEADDAVTVRLTSSGRAGAMVGVSREVRVSLRAPLQGRGVLDPARGIRHEAFDGARLRALVPPDGYRQPWETAPHASPWEAKAPDTWCLTTAPAAGVGPLLSLSHTTDTTAIELVEADWVVVTHLPNDPAVPVLRSLAHRGLMASWLDTTSGHRLTLTSSSDRPFASDDPFLTAARAL